MMKLALFDFDGTLFTRDTLPYIAKVWLNQTGNIIIYCFIYISIFPTLLLYKLKIIPREVLKYNAFKRFHRIFKGMKKNEIRILFEKVYENIYPYFNQQVIKEIVAAKSQGFHTVLLSGAYSELLNVIAEKMGIDTVIGAELPYNEDLFDTHNPVPFINGEVKKRLLQSKFGTMDINWAESRSFADSITDLPILTFVGEPVAVNPEPGLFKIAVNNNWRVIS
jgi:HAD superfamily hydrolase (TIGR01490 family)